MCHLRLIQCPHQILELVRAHRYTAESTQLEDEAENDRAKPLSVRHRIPPARSRMWTSLGVREGIRRLEERERSEREREAPRADRNRQLPRPLPKERFRTMARGRRERRKQAEVLPASSR